MLCILNIKKFDKQREMKPFKILIFLFVLFFAIVSKGQSVDFNTLTGAEQFDLDPIDQKDLIIKEISPYRKSIYTKTCLQRHSKYDILSDRRFVNYDCFTGISCLIPMSYFNDIKRLRREFLKNGLQLFITDTHMRSELSDNSIICYRVSILPEENLKHIFHLYGVESVMDNRISANEIYDFYSMLEKRYSVSFIGIGSTWILITLDNEENFDQVMKEIKDFSYTMTTYKNDWILRRLKKDGLIEVHF